MLNERLQRMRNKLWDSRPCITAERLELETEAYKQFAGDAIPGKSCKLYYGAYDDSDHGG